MLMECKVTIYKDEIKKIFSRLVKEYNLYHLIKKDNLLSENNIKQIIYLPGNGLCNNKILLSYYYFQYTHLSTMWIKILNEKYFYKIFMNFLSQDGYCNDVISYINYKKFIYLPPYCFISSGFIWDRTKEGYDFWENKCDDWNYYLNSICVK